MNNKFLKTENEPENINSENLMNYLNITGVNRLNMTDDQGNTNTPLGVVDKPVPGINYEYGSPVGESLVIPHEVTFLSGKVVEIKFRAATEKITIENIKGQGRENAVEAVKYLDLQLPINSMALLRFSADGIENLRYDADGDGNFETEVQPTFRLVGASANDFTPPDIDIAFTVNNNIATVTVNTSDDETGINQVRYIVNGENVDHIYSAPFTINPAQSRLVYVSAEDNAGNRNLLAKWIDVNSPTTIANQTPAPTAGGWSKSDANINLKSLDDVGGAGVDTLTFSADGAQTIPEETIKMKEIPLSLPQPSKATDFLSKSFIINTEGITNLSFSAKDRAGNIERIKTLAVKIDKTSPSSSHNFAINGLAAIVILSSSDALSGVASIYYSVDGSNPQTYSNPFTVSGGGNHTVSYYAVDLAGNIETAKSFNLSLGNSAPTQAVRPVLECVAATDNGTYIAKFGYENDNSVPVSIPVGASNKFTPSPQDGGQTTNFQPGRISFAFEVPFNGGNLVWTLKGPDNRGRTSTASANSTRCQ